MKIKPDHFRIMVNALDAIQPKLIEAIPAYKAEGMSKIRFQWDAFRAARIDGDSVRWQCDTLYPYLNDTHVQSALNAAFKQLKLDY